MMSRARMAAERAKELREHARRAGRRAIKADPTARDFRVLADLLRVALDELAVFYEAESDNAALDERPAFVGSVDELARKLDEAP